MISPKGEGDYAVENLRLKSIGAYLSIDWLVIKSFVVLRKGIMGKKKYQVVGIFWGKSRKSEGKEMVNRQE
jgi:hypothetical protein